MNMNQNGSSIYNAKSDFIIQHDFIQRLNYQKTILNPQIIDEAMNKIKRQLTSEQIIELINGKNTTQQLIAENSVSAIRKILNKQATNHFAYNSPNVQLEHNHTYGNNNGFEMNLNNSDSQIQSPINSQSISKSQQSNRIIMNANDTDIEILNNNNNNNNN
eukprot:204699_1